MRKLSSANWILIWGMISLGLNGTELAAQDTSTQGWNAAVNYWQAFGLMPEWTEEERKLFSSLPAELGSTLPAGVKELTERCGGALNALELANRVERCDWQLDYAQGPMLSLPHSQKARELGRLSVLRARYRLSTGDNTGGIADALATLRLARAIGSDQILISLLVTAAIERPAIELLAAYFPRFSEAERKQLLDGWQALKSAPTLASSLAMEKKVFGGWLTAELNRAASGKRPEESVGEFGKSLSDLMEAAAVENGPTKEAVSRMTIAAAKREVEQYLADCDELVRIAGLSFPERKQQFTEFEQELEQLKNNKASTERQFSRMFLPAITRVPDAEEGWVTRRKMFEVAVKGGSDGQAGIGAAAQELGIEVDYISAGEGFELHSPVTTAGKRESLRFGGGYLSTK